MTPLPAPLGGGELVAWRLDVEKFALAWDSGDGAFSFGGRWNSKGVRAVYCSVDPATAILEVAAHKGFPVLDMVPHILTALTISASDNVRVIDPSQVPDPGWLRPDIPAVAQQAFGDGLLADGKFVLIPSAVSSHSWNLIFDPRLVKPGYSFRSRERFVLDPRLHPASSR